MTAVDRVHIKLTLAEEHTLKDLLDSFIRPRVEEAVELARGPEDFQAAANKAHRLGVVYALALGDGMLDPPDADHARTDLIMWGAETEDTVREHLEIIAEKDGNAVEQLKAERDACRRSAIDYAHQQVCQRIVGQIDAARELVAV